MKRLILTASLFLAATTLALAGNPKETKEAKPEAKTETETGVVKWFHFNGNASNPSDLTDPAKYSAQAAPTCPSLTKAYRCDIKILSQSANQNLPDLSQPIQEERKRDTE